jgi:hypothetical protein
MTTTDPTANPQNDDQTARRLAQSLESTGRGLEAFAQSVQPLREALPSYVQMQTVVVQQRLWSSQHGRQELEPLWRRIAANAGQLHAVFSGFARVMDLLRAIETLEQHRPTEATPSPTPEIAEMDERFARWLATVLAGFTLTAARQATLRPKRTTSAYLRKLVRMGVFERDRRSTYRLTDASRRRIAAALLETLNGESADT